MVQSENNVCITTGTLLEGSNIQCQNLGNVNVKNSIFDYENLPLSNVNIKISFCEM